MSFMNKFKWYRESIGHKWYHIRFRTKTGISQFWTQDNWFKGVFIINKEDYDKRR